MTTAALKRASEIQLQRLGIAVNEHLPEIEPLAELSPRLPADVVRRACVLSHVIGVGYGRSGKQMLSWLADAGLQTYLTPNESNLLGKSRLTLEEKAWAAWHAAAVHACAWALQIESMEPMTPCPESLAAHFPPRMNPSLALQGTGLRHASELHACADLYYRLHWAARDAALTGHSLALAEPEIAMRRKALDWIIGLPHEWDDIPLDT